MGSGEGCRKESYGGGWTKVERDEERCTGTSCECVNTSGGREGRTDGRASLVRLFASPQSGKPESTVGEPHRSELRPLTGTC